MKTGQSEHLDALRQRIKQAPLEPGCYLWQNQQGKVLYVGKARELRKRLTSYLNPDPENGRIRHLMQRVGRVDWVVTGNEAEALILESSLVKEHRPRYNVRLKDDKSYPWVCISLSEPFPRVFLTRNTAHTGNRYFGPYTDVRAARSTLNLLHKIFPVRKVKQKLPLKKPGKPCINFHIKRCLGPCTGRVAESDYNNLIEQIILFLEGRRETVERLINVKMQSASERQAYELAAMYRDMLQEIRSLQTDQNIHLPGMRHADVLALALQENEAQVVLLEFRSGIMTARKSFPLTGVRGLEPAEALYSFLRDHYLASQVIPDRLLLGVPLAAPERRLFEEVLANRAEKKVRLLAARRQLESRYPIIKLARRNAEMLLQERLHASQIRDREAALDDLQAILNLAEPPGVIECYDISHLQGTETVAAGVVFLDGAPRTAAYRRYQIRSVQGINDPASIREVIARRLQRLINENQALPDLIVIDGGITQLNAACEAATALELGSQPIVSLAKRLEEIYVPGHPHPLQLDANRPGMRLLRQLRDEAHRFAVTYQRQRRTRTALQSVLDDIPSIGAERRKAILLHVKGRPPEVLDQAALEAIPGIGPRLAQQIHTHLQARQDNSA